MTYFVRDCEILHVKRIVKFSKKYKSSFSLATINGLTCQSNSSFLAYIYARFGLGDNFST